MGDDFVSRRAKSPADCILRHVLQDFLISKKSVAVVVDTLGLSSHRPPFACLQLSVSIGVVAAHDLADVALDLGRRKLALCDYAAVGKIYGMTCREEGRCGQCGALADNAEQSWIPFHG